MESERTSSYSIYSNNYGYIKTLIIRIDTFIKLYKALYR